MKMKKALAMLLAAGMVVSLAACSSGGSENGSDASGEEEVTLTVWVAPALVSEEEQKMKQEDWYVSKVAEKFEEEHPGVNVEFTVVSDQSAAHQTFKAAATTETGPDIANLWSGQSIFAMEDVILDIRDYVPEEDFENIMG